MNVLFSFPFSGTLPRVMKKKIGLFSLLFLALAIGISQLPGIQSRLAWRIEVAKTYAHGILFPAGDVPTAKPHPTVAPSLTPREPPSPSPIPTLPLATETPLPKRVLLTQPAYEQQDMNNCGPATLTMALRYFGWEGTQFDISDIVKPKRPDRNVNPEELAYYVNNYAGWLRAIYRVNGDAARLKALISAGFPVIIEETFRFEEPYWLHDDLWAAHYLLLTGYDDAAREFTSQDSFHGENQILPYDELEENWEPFNHLYFIVYLPEEEDEIKGILGEDWEEDSNRKRALAASQKRIQENPDDAFAWFNLGSNLLYFERYDEAADAYDTARNLGLPQRMMRYQFGPFIAYFQSNRIDDLLTLTNYALKITPTSEEALLWRGWAKYREGDYAAARKDWEEALARHPGYADAEYALRFLSGNSP